MYYLSDQYPHRWSLLQNFCHGLEHLSNPPSTPQKHLVEAVSNWRWMVKLKGRSWWVCVNGKWKAVFSTSSTIWFIDGVFGFPNMMAITIDGAFPYRCSRNYADGSNTIYNNTICDVNQYSSFVSHKKNEHCVVKELMNKENRNSRFEENLKAIERRWKVWECNSSKFIAQPDADFHVLWAPG